jgi:hypothetical protein
MAAPSMRSLALGGHRLLSTGAAVWAGRAWRKAPPPASLAEVIRAEQNPFEPPRAPVWARPGGNWREISEAEALYFAGAALAALDSVARSEPPWAGRLARPPGAQIRRRRRPDPAQPARGRVCAARRRRPGEARPGAGAWGKSLRRVPDALRARRPVAPRAVFRRRRRPDGAARPRKGC